MMKEDQEHSLEIPSKLVVTSFSTWSRGISLWNRVHLRLYVAAMQLCTSCLIQPQVTLDVLEAVQVLGTRFQLYGEALPVQRRRYIRAHLMQLNDAPNYKERDIASLMELDLTCLASPSHVL